MSAADKLALPPIGVGTWAWGEKPYWGYGDDYGPDEVVEAFGEAVASGLTFFDTAEVYGHGESEKILGFLAEKHASPLIIASKFGLLPGRPGAKVLRKALEASLRRLRLRKIDLYQVHWPDTQMASIESLMDAMADAVADGLIGAVGVSNFSADETKRAHEALDRRGLSLFSNQVRYNLLYRAPETNGVLDACKQTGALLLAYSPLEQGLLAGRYLTGPRPAGKRGNQAWFSDSARAAASAVVTELDAIAQRRGMGTAEVAIRWLMETPGVVPLVGVTRGEHAQAAARALTFSLTEDERERLARVSHEAAPSP